MYAIETTVVIVKKFSSSDEGRDKNDPISIYVSGSAPQCKLIYIYLMTPALFLS